MEISIIIPAWHEEKTIVRTLDALKQLDCSLKECELIIVASNDDNTYSIAKRKSMPEFGRYLVLKQNPGGKNAALQQGIKESKGEFIVLLDADTIVEKNWLSELIEPIKSGKAVCTNGNFFPVSFSIFNNYFMIEKIWGRQMTKQQSTQGKGGIALKKDIIEKIGIDNLFNKEIYSGVDHYLGERILENGDYIYFAEKAKTKSYLNHTVKGFAKDQIRWNNSYFQQIAKIKALNILFFNLAVLSSFILFLSSFFASLFLAMPFIAYSAYLLMQCLTCSAYSNNLILFFYFPIYLFLSLIDRTVALGSFIHSFIGKKKAEVHFKGER
jgi:cellulose synthase/poly-beta-1,6-N-acetylglucosamine synthase-like glycosyltransferase